MDSKDIIGTIELGDVNIKCLIFQIVGENETEILSKSVTSSEGIDKDIIVNLAKASNSIRASISAAEKKAKISLKKINVIFEQPDFLCTRFSKNKKINGSKIHKDDIDFLLKEAKKELIQNDKNQSIIHIFNHNYIVDGKKFIEEPIGVYADSLTHEITFITTKKNNLRNIYQAFSDCDIKIERFLSRTFVLGVKLLNVNDLNNGSALIDLGFEKISLGVFKNLVLINSKTFPFGINNIIKDISKVCSLNMEESRNIKNNFDFSFEKNSNLFDEKDFLKNEYFLDSNYRKISKNLIYKVVKARLDEIILLIKKELNVSNYEKILGSNFLISGEGLSLFNIEKYLINFFEENVKKVNIDVKKNENLEENFSSSLGALKVIKDGWETEALPEISNQNIGKIGFFAKFFGINK